METEKVAANTDHERKFGLSWILPVFVVICTAYVLWQLR
jgi:hypothetical protein